MAKCPKCGGNLVESQDGLMYVCDECGSKFKKKAGSKAEKANDAPKKEEAVPSKSKKKAVKKSEEQPVKEVPKAKEVKEKAVKEAQKATKKMPKIEGIEAEKEAPKMTLAPKAPVEQGPFDVKKLLPIFIGAAVLLIAVIVLALVLPKKNKAESETTTIVETQEAATETTNTSMELEEGGEAAETIDFIDPFDESFFGTDGNNSNVSFEWSGASPYCSLIVTNNFSSTDYRSHLLYEVKNNGKIATGDDVLITAKLSDEAQEAGFTLTRDYTTVTCKEPLSYISFVSEIDDNTWGLMKEDAIKAVKDAQEIIANGQSDESFVPISINGNSIKPETEDVKYGFYDGANVKKVKFTKAILFSKKNGKDPYDNKLYLVFKCNRTGSKRPGNPTLEGAVSFVEVKESLLLQDNGEIKYNSGMLEAMLAQMFTSQEKFDEVLLTQMKEDYNITEMPLDWVVE